MDGIDVLLRQADYLPLRALRWGLVTNASSLTSAQQPVRQALLQTGFRIVALFAPEHGLSATGADGVAQAHHRDTLTQLPVYSLYGPAFAPDSAVMADLDGIIFDLPDAGVRFYTYLWTLLHLMETCLAHHKKLLIADRPNPLSGALHLAEGPMLDESNLSSFIGRRNIPIRHCLTFGELARYWQALYGWAALDMDVVPIAHWPRTQYLADRGLPFVPPSPAINHIDTLLTYPALCYMEGTVLSEGRGTDAPFRQAGAPEIDGVAWARQLDALPLVGARAEAVVFRPTAYRHAGQLCRGIRLHVTDRTTYQPVQVGMALLATLRLTHPTMALWGEYPTHANPTGQRHLDLLFGTTYIRQLLDENPAQVLTQLPALTHPGDWAARVQPFLLYD